MLTSYTLEFYTKVKLEPSKSTEIQQTQRVRVIREKRRAAYSMKIIIFQND